MADSEGIAYEPGKLVVWGLSSETTKESLVKYFSQFGEISSFGSTVEMDDTARTRGYGFVTFVNPDHAELVFQYPDIHMIDSKKVKFKRVEKSEPTIEQPLKVLLSNLPMDATADDIRKELSKFGPISTAHDAIDVRMDNTGRSKGSGFVTFETEDAAKAAVKEHYVYLGPRQVEINKVDLKPRMYSGHPGYSPRHPGYSPRHPGYSPRHHGYSPRHPGYPPQQQQQQGGSYGYGSGAYPTGYPQQWGYSEQYGGGSAAAPGYYPQPQGSNPMPSYNGAAYSGRSEQHCQQSYNNDFSSQQ